MNKESFLSTGLIMNIKDYMQANPQAKLHIDTFDVLVYKDGHTIEMLKTGEFMYNNQRSKSIEEVEEILWKDIAEKYQ